MILQKGLECQYWFFCSFWSVFTVFTKILCNGIKLCTCTNLGYISYWLQSKIRLGYMQWEKMKNLTFTNEKICSILHNCNYTLSANSLCFFNINLESAKKKRAHLLWVWKVAKIFIQSRCCCPPYFLLVLCEDFLW